MAAVIRAYRPHEPTGKPAASVRIQSFALNEILTVSLDQSERSTATPARRPSRPRGNSSDGRTLE